MLDMVEIEDSIRELEEGQTNFVNCQKLAILYTVKDHLNKDTPEENVVIQEYADILPMYSNYCDIKRKYQMKEVTEEAVINSIENVAKEIQEFIKTLYSNVDTQDEKHILTNMVAELKTLY